MKGYVCIFWHYMYITIKRTKIGLLTSITKTILHKLNVKKVISEKPTHANQKPKTNSKTRNWIIMEISFDSSYSHTPLFPPQDSTRLPFLPIKNPRLFPIPGYSVQSQSHVKHCGIGFPILKLYIKKHFKRTMGEALQGPRVFQYPQKENHLLVGKSLSSPQDHWTSSGKMWAHVVNYGYCWPQNLRCHILLPITLAKKPKSLRFPAFQDLKDFLPTKAKTWLSGVYFSSKH